MSETEKWREACREFMEWCDANKEDDFDLAANVLRDCISERGLSLDELGECEHEWWYEIMYIRPGGGNSTDRYYCIKCGAVKP